jgi:hypothetical protein
MKTYLIGLLAAGILVLGACSNEKGAYIDLRSGQEIEVKKDPATGEWINVKTGEPVYLYVDTKRDDTIYGKTGEVVNGHVVLSDDTWWYDDDPDYKIKDGKTKVGDLKIKREDDGDLKIKDENRKRKYDDGEVTIKKE